MTTNDQLILTGGQACVRELCWQIYRFNLHVISNHTPYLQTLGFHGRIRVTTNENNDKVGRKCHMLHDQCCPALIENDAVRFENSLHNTHTKIRNETSTSLEDWISEFTEPKEQGYWILTFRPLTDLPKWSVAKRQRSLTELSQTTQNTSGINKSFFTRRIPEPSLT